MKANVSDIYSKKRGWLNMKKKVIEKTQIFRGPIFEIWEFMTEEQKNLILFSGFFQSYFDSGE